MVTPIVINLNVAETSIYFYQRCGSWSPWFISNGGVITVQTLKVSPLRNPIEPPEVTIEYKVCKTSENVDWE